jgi:hypothetical protein
MRYSEVEIASDRSQQSGDEEINELGEDNHSHQIKKIVDTLSHPGDS